MQVFAKSMLFLALSTPATISHLASAKRLRGICMSNINYNGGDKTTIKINGDITVNGGVRNFGSAADAGFGSASNNAHAARLIAESQAAAQQHAANAQAQAAQAQAAFHQQQAQMQVQSARMQQQLQLQQAHMQVKMAQQQTAAMPMAALPMAAPVPGTGSHGTTTISTSSSTTSSRGFSLIPRVFRRAQRNQSSAPVTHTTYHDSMPAAMPMPAAAAPPPKPSAPPAPIVPSAEQPMEADDCQVYNGSHGAGKEVHYSAPVQAAAAQPSAPTVETEAEREKREWNARWNAQKGTQ